MTRLTGRAQWHEAAAALIAPGSAQARTETCQVTDGKAVAGVFDPWNASLKMLDPAKVTANYAANGVLLPTVSNTPRTNHAEINDCFVKFLKNQPQCVIDKRFIKIGCNVEQDVGTYTFGFKDGSKLSAHYSYVYEFRDGQRLITHSHSSAMPETR